MTMLLLPARCLSGAQERVSEAMAILAFIGLSRTLRDAPRPPIVEIVSIPTPEFHTCEHIIDRIDALSDFIAWARNPNRELIAV